MRVKALSEGFYDNRRQKEGSIFVIKEKEGLDYAERDERGYPKSNKMVKRVFSIEDQFSSKWMVECDENGKPIEKKGSDKDKEPDKEPPEGGNESPAGNDKPPESNEDKEGEGSEGDDNLTVV